MTDGILLVFVSSHFDCSDPSIPPRGPYVLYSSLKECRKGAWRHASSQQPCFQYNSKHAKHRLCHYSRQLTYSFLTHCPFKSAISGYILDFVGNCSCHFVLYRKSIIFTLCCQKRWFTVVLNKQITFCITVNSTGLTSTLTGTAGFYCEKVSIGKNPGPLCHVRKSFYGPFPATCAIFIDLNSHLNSSVLPWSAAIERIVTQVGCYV